MRTQGLRRLRKYIIYFIPSKSQNISLISVRPLQSTECSTKTPQFPSIQKQTMSKSVPSPLDDKKMNPCITANTWWSMIKSVLCSHLLTIINTLWSWNSQSTSSHLHISLFLLSDNWTRITLPINQVTTDLYTPVSLYCDINLMTVLWLQSHLMKYMQSCTCCFMTPV